MARRSRESLSTSFFHVIVQGLNKEYIFEQNRYKEKYLKILIKTNEKYNVDIVSYCIMSNHAHILIYADDVIELSNFMKNANEDYARYYNYVTERTGYVFRGRFSSEPITDIRYLLNCIAYIHKNPVKVLMVDKCDEYPYSSYKKYIDNPSFLRKELCEIIFGCDSIDIEQFKQIHLLKDYYFMENVDMTSENIQEIIVEYECKYGMNWNQIITNADKVEEIVLEIKKRMSVSNRKLSQYSNINRNTIDRIIKKS